MMTQKNNTKMNATNNGKCSKTITKSTEALSEFSC